MPDSISSCGEPIAPAHTITSADGVRLRWCAVAEVADAGAPAAPHVQAGDQAAGLDGQVRAVQGGPQVGVGRADPPPAGDGQVGPGHPFLLIAAEVIGDRAAERAQGLGERAGDRMPAGFGDRGDPDRAAGAAQRRVAAVGVLAAPEVRQQVRESPAGRAGGGPAVIDRPVAAHVRHGVDRAGPAQPPAAGVGQGPGLGLGGGDAGPVRRSADQFGPARPGSSWRGSARSFPLPAAAPGCRDPR